MTSSGRSTTQFRESHKPWHNNCPTTLLLAKDKGAERAAPSRPRCHHSKWYHMSDCHNRGCKRPNQLHQTSHRHRSEVMQLCAKNNRTPWKTGQSTTYILIRQAMNSQEVTSITFTLFASNSPLHIFEMYCKMQFSHCGKKNYCGWMARMSPTLMMAKIWLNFKIFSNV